MPNKIEAINSYIKRCIKDAHSSEKRDYNPDNVFWFWCVVDNIFMYYIKTPYARVSRRVNYRINNNIYKKFGFKCSVAGSLFMDKDDFQINFARNKICCGNSYTFYINDFGLFADKVGDVIPCYQYEKLCLAYFDITLEEYKNSFDKKETYHVPYSSLNWNEYRELFKKAFGEYPDLKISSYGCNLDVEFCE